MAQFTPPLTEAEIATAFPGAFSTVATLFTGGQGAVFRCERTDGSVALKVYAPHTGAHLEERTEREVAALEAIVRPTVVRLTSHGAVFLRGTDCRFVSTEFIDGISLQDRLQSGALTVDGLVQIGHDVADAIAAFWEPHRIVHRDLKPNNIMLSSGGRAVVIDLGVARHTMMDSLTVTGNSWGTAGHLSPEQAACRKSLTCKSDVFALGIVLQQCLTGAHPTGGDQRLLLSGGRRTVVVAPGTDPTLAVLIDAMLARDPARRPKPEQIVRFFAPRLARQVTW